MGTVPTLCYSLEAVGTVTGSIYDRVMITFGPMFIISQLVSGHNFMDLGHYPAILYME